MFVQRLYSALLKGFDERPSLCSAARWFENFELTDLCFIEERMELFCAEFPLMLLTLCETLHSLPLGAPGRVDVYLCVQQILQSFASTPLAPGNDKFCSEVAMSFLTEGLGMSQLVPSEQVVLGCRIVTIEACWNVLLAVTSDFAQAVAQEQRARLPPRDDLDAALERLRLSVAVDGPLLARVRPGVVQLCAATGKQADVPSPRTAASAALAAVGSLSRVMCFRRAFMSILPDLHALAKTGAAKETKVFCLLIPILKRVCFMMFLGWRAPVQVPGSVSRAYQAFLDQLGPAGKQFLEPVAPAEP
jgi:hypothetical protein